MADFTSSATLRYICEGVAGDDHSDFAEMIERYIEGSHRGFYAGRSSGDYLAGLRTRGGIIFRRQTGEPAAFFPLAARCKDGLRLQFPIIEHRDENRGLQCFGQWLQLISALQEATPKNPPHNLYIPFPDDKLPSPKLVHLLGLCDSMPERPPLRDRPIAMSAAHRFDIQSEMLPRIVGAMLERHDPWAGTSSLTSMHTSGTAGRARTYLPADLTPLDPIWMPMLVLIAAGKLSVIGLKDLPVTRYGA